MPVDATYVKFDSSAADPSAQAGFGFLYSNGVSGLFHRTVAGTDQLLKDSRELTINGTNNQITVTGGGQDPPDLSADRTWTLSLDPTISTIGTLTTEADKGIYYTGSDAAATFDLTSTARSILDDGSIGAVRTTITLDQNDAVEHGSLFLGIQGGDGTVSSKAGANNITMITLKRNTDTNPGGQFLNFKNVADGSLFGLDIAGKIIQYGGAAPSNGQILIGGTSTTNFAAATITGTTNQINVTNGNNSITLSMPQNIHTGATPSFTGANLSAGTTTVGSLSGMIDAGGATSFEVPNSVAPAVDAFGEIAGDNNFFGTGRGGVLWYDGTSPVVGVGVLSTDDPTVGTVPKITAAGQITWEKPIGTTLAGSNQVVLANTSDSLISDAGLLFNIVSADNKTLELKSGTTGATLSGREGSSNGTNSAAFAWPDLLTANYEIALPDPGGDVDLPVVLNRATSATSVNNTTAENTIYSFSIPANALGTNKTAHLVIRGKYLNSSTGTATITLRYKFGATTLFDDVSASIVSHGLEKAVRFEFDLTNLSSTSSQELSGTLAISPNTVTTAGLGDFSTDEQSVASVIYGTSSEATTSAKSITVTVQHSVADANITFTLTSAILVLQ